MSDPELNPALSAVEREAFLKALDYPEGRSRTAFLDGTLGNASGLRRGVDALLAAHLEAPEHFLESTSARKIAHPQPDGRPSGTGKRECLDVPETKSFSVTQEKGGFGVAGRLPPPLDWTALPSQRHLENWVHPGGGPIPFETS